MHRIAIFASGRGSNAEKIIQYFEGREEVEVSLIASNRSKAGVLDLADQHHIESIILDKQMLEDPEELIQFLYRRQIKLIVLAGFLKKIPLALIEAYSRRIMNIHPSLLPKYGGKGMYGMHVHKAVLAAGEEESGITIHLVNQKYDDGRVLFQKEVSLQDAHTAEEIASKVLELEHYYYPRVIENYITSHL